jgi:anti-sigma regulatory factor (Ser/Thr protein kinase)
MLLEDAATWEARPSTPARARQLVERVLERSGHPDLAATAVLLTSELVTNAVEYAGGAVTVRARCDDHVLRVEVGDGDAGMPRIVDVVNDALGGRGMHLVDALATRWSTGSVDGGKVVWFELALR